MERLPRDQWIQAFCLLMATADPQAYGGGLLGVAAECWEHSQDIDPSIAVQRLMIAMHLDAANTRALRADDLARERMARPGLLAQVVQLQPSTASDCIER